MRGYLRVAVQAVLGGDEETVDYPLGVRQSARISFPDTGCAARTEKQSGTTDSAGKDSCSEEILGPSRDIDIDKSNEIDHNLFLICRCNIDAYDDLSPTFHISLTTH